MEQFNSFISVYSHMTFCKFKSVRQKFKLTMAYKIFYGKKDFQRSANEYLNFPPFSKEPISKLFINLNAPMCTAPSQESAKMFLRNAAKLQKFAPERREIHIFTYLWLQSLENYFSEKRFDRTCLKGMLKASFNQTIMKKLQSLFFFLSNPVPLM